MSTADTIRQQRQIRSKTSEPLPSSKRGEIRRAREQEARRIEKDANYHLNRIVTDIAADDSQDISVLQRKYSQEVEDIIRAAANNGYIAGVNYLGDTKEMQHAMYLTTPDIAKVKALTAEFTEIFWRRIAVILHKQDIIHSILSARFSFHSTLTFTNVVTSFVARLVTKAIAQGTLTKVRALSPRTRKSVMLSAQADDPGAATAVMQWHTQEDEKVCPICEELDGQQWYADDPEMPEPPDDTHENCRCRLEIVPPNEVNIADTTPPSQDDLSGLLGLGISSTAASALLGLMAPDEAKSCMDDILDTFDDVTSDDQAALICAAKTDIMDKNPDVKEDDAIQQAKAQVMKKEKV